MLDPNTVVSLAEISQYLWNETIPRENQFFNGTIDPRKANQLYIVRKGLQYGISENLSGLPGLSQYTYALCGAKLAQAQNILGTGQGGGGVVPGNGGNFAVNEYSANAIQGTITIYFPQAIGKRLINAFRQGNNIGTILTSGTPTGNQVTWDKDAGSLTVASDVAFYDNEFVRVVVQQ